MKRVTRWIAYAGGALLIVCVGVVGYVYYASNNKADRRYDALVEHITVTSDSTTLARGKHLATAIGKCGECHGDDLGGKVMIDDPTLGIVSAPNLTSGVGSAIAGASDDEIARMIRHGIKRDGRSVTIMPAEDYQYMSDRDVAALIAYLHSLPAVDRPPGRTALRPVGRALVAANLLPFYRAELVDHARRAPVEVVADTSLTYGAYLANIGGCTGCHGPGLSGGPIPGMPPDAPPAANLTPTGLGKYSDAEIETVMRTGTRPDGSAVKTEMPWRYTALMSPLEMRATIRYLRSVPAKPFGLR